MRATSVRWFSIVNNIYVRNLFSLKWDLVGVQVQFRVKLQMKSLRKFWSLATWSVFQFKALQTNKCQLTYILITPDWKCGTEHRINYMYIMAFIRYAVSIFELISSWIAMVLQWHGQFSVSYGEIKTAPVPMDSSAEINPIKQITRRTIYSYKCSFQNSIPAFDILLPAFNRFIPALNRFCLHFCYWHPFYENRP